jgi:hypothetical protein
MALSEEHTNTQHSLARRPSKDVSHSVEFFNEGKEHNLPSSVAPCCCEIQYIAAAVWQQCLLSPSFFSLVVSLCLLFYIAASMGHDALKGIFGRISYLLACMLA